MAQILSIGSNLSAMHTRQLLLEQEGHTVVGAINEKALAAACELITFDVAVLSQTLSPKVKQRIAFLIREHCPGIKLLELYSAPNGHALEDADSWIEVPGNGPSQLTAGVAELAMKMADGR
jgi:hypothetical protein